MPSTLSIGVISFLHDQATGVILQIHTTVAYMMAVYHPLSTDTESYPSVERICLTVENLLMRTHSHVLGSGNDNLLPVSGSSFIRTPIKCKLSADVTNIIHS